jgi:hypothetical protein
LDEFMAKTIRASLTATAVLIALTGAAQAKPKSNTLLLGDLGDGAKLWLMLDSVRQDEKAIRHAWSIIDYPGPQSLHELSYQSDASKFYVDCKGHRISLANAIKFAGHMGGGANVIQANSEPTPEPAAEDFHPVRPGTAEEVVAQAICKQKIR